MVTMAVQISTARMQVAALPGRMPVIFFLAGKTG
jgi:hypothetical protein